MDPGDHPTVLNEAGPRVPPAAWITLADSLGPGRVVVSGSVPGGTSAEDYRALLASLRGPVTVDAGGDLLAAALETDRDAGRPELVAPNAEELLDALAALGSVTVGDPLTAARQLHERYAVRVLVSLGPAGAALVADRSLRVDAPKVVAANPVGSGDCLLGAFLWAEEEGWTAEEALRVAVAAGSDNARKGGGGKIAAGDVRELAAACSVIDLG